MEYKFFEQPKDHSVKFGDNLPSGLGDLVLSKLLSDKGHHRISIAHLEPMAQVS